MTANAMDEFDARVSGLRPYLGKPGVGSSVGNAWRELEGGDQDAARRWLDQADCYAGLISVGEFNLRYPIREEGTR